MMTDSKHTPGPWRISGVSMQTGNVSVSMEEHRIVIAEVTNAASFGDMIAGAMRRGGGSFDQGDCHTQMSNARLIAAAPEMLEALQTMVSLVKDALQDDTLDASTNAGSILCGDIMSETLRNALATIAKATA